MAIDHSLSPDRWFSDTAGVTRTRLREDHDRFAVNSVALTTARSLLLGNAPPFSRTSATQSAGGRHAAWRRRIEDR